VKPNDQNNKKITSEMILCIGTHRHQELVYESQQQILSRISDHKLIIYSCSNAWWKPWM